MREEVKDGSSVGTAPRLAPAAGFAAGPRLRRRVRRASRVGRGGSLLQAEVGVASQNGEDGVLREILRRIGEGNRYFVEFGASAGAQGNCVLLADYYEWSGLFIEADAARYARLEDKYRARDRVQTLNTRVTADGIDALLRAAGVPPEPDVLSIDIDGNDFWVWSEIAGITPRVVVVEYNGNLAPDEQYVMPRDDLHSWDGTDYFGASLGALRRLGAEKGYRFVHAERTGTNAFFVIDSCGERFADLAAPRAFYPNYLGRGTGLSPDPADRPFLDLRSGSLVSASRTPAAG